MKTARAYLLSAAWFVAYCAAAYYGWGQDVAGVRNLVYVSLALSAGVSVALTLIAMAVVHADSVGKQITRPTAIEHQTSAAWVIWRTLILSAVFAWFGALFVSLAIQLLVAILHTARLFFNTAVAESGIRA